MKSLTAYAVGVFLLFLVTTRNYVYGDECLSGDDCKGSTTAKCEVGMTTYCCKLPQTFLTLRKKLIVVTSCDCSVSLGMGFDCADEDSAAAQLFASPALTAILVLLVRVLA